MRECRSTQVHVVSALVWPDFFARTRKVWLALREARVALRARARPRTSRSRACTRTSRRVGPVNENDALVDARRVRRLRRDRRSSERSRRRIAIAVTTAAARRGHPARPGASSWPSPLSSGGSRAHRQVDLERRALALVRRVARRHRDRVRGQVARSSRIDSAGTDPAGSAVVLRSCTRASRTRHSRECSRSTSEACLSPCSRVEHEARRCSLGTWFGFAIVNGDVRRRARVEEARSAIAGLERRRAPPRRRCGRRVPEPVAVK